MAGRSRLRRLVPAIGLIFLSPWVGEFLLGSSPIQYLPAALVLLVPLYGGGALLIREIARRFGRGYPTMVLLGAAYGVIEAGLLDQSMFNPDFLELENDPDSNAGSFFISVNNAAGYVVGHAIWSITIPIAMIELMAPQRGAAPWLGRAGLAATTGLYLIGCAIVFSFIYAEYRFLATPVQLAGAAVAALLLICIAFVIGKESGAPRSAAGKEVKPWHLGLGSFFASSLFVSRPENWAGFSAGLLLLAAAWLMLHRWSRCSWWGNRHRFALVAGAVLTYAWLGFVVTYMLWPEDWVAWCGNVLFALAAVALLAVISKRTKESGRRSDDATT